MLPDVVRSAVALLTATAIAWMLGRSIWTKRGGLQYVYGAVLVLVFSSTLLLPFDHDAEYGTIRFWFCYLALGYAAIGKANFEIGPVDLLVEIITLVHTIACIQLSRFITHRGILLVLRIIDPGPHSK